MDLIKSRLCLSLVLDIYLLLLIFNLELNHLSLPLLVTTQLEVLTALEYSILGLGHFSLIYIYISFPSSIERVMLLKSKYSTNCFLTQPNNCNTRILKERQEQREYDILSKQVPSGHLHNRYIYFIHF